MNDFLQDLRFGLRQLFHRRATTAVAVLTLALGIGANTTMFSLLDATLYRRPSAVAPDRLAWLTYTYGRSRQPQNGSYPDYMDVRDRAKSFSSVLGYAHAWLSFGGSTPERIRGELVTGNYFDALGVRAAQGRMIRPDEDGVPGAHAVAVLSDAFWRRRFGADPAIVNGTITINGHPFTVVGVAPPEFSGVEINDDEPMAVWIPISMTAVAEPGWDGLLTDRNSAGWLRAIGRLAQGATMASANAELSVIAAQLRPGETKEENKIGLAASSVAGGMDPSNRGELLPILALLMAVPALVLLVACANAANVLLARGMARRKEIAVRRALGASRMRLMRQLLTESVLLSLVAGAVGVLLSFWMTGLIAQLGDVPAGIVAALTPDWNVIIAATLLAVASGIIFGFAPALTATRAELTPALKEDSSTSRVGKHRLRDVLLVGQVAVSLVLLVTAALFTRSLSKALRVDPGYGATSGVYLSFDLGRQNYSPDRQESFVRELLTRVRAVSGVEATALASTVPFGGSFNGGQAVAEGADEGAAGASYMFSSITPGYFETLRVPVLRGRAFTDADAASTELVAIVNETLARRLWPNADALGKHFRLGRTGVRPLLQVVGIVRDGKYVNLVESPRGYLFLPLRQKPSASLVLAVRSSVEAAGLLPAVRRVSQSIDPDLPLFNVRTFAQALRGAADKQQAASSMLAVFGVLALLLAALGMFSVTAHGVALRTREIGIRMSLGARTTDVLALFVRESMSRTLVGVVIGLAASAALSTLLAGFLFGLKATDATAFVTGGVVLCVVTALASYIPARRAARLDPLVALRAE